LRLGLFGPTRLQIATREFHLARLFVFVPGRQRQSEAVLPDVSHLAPKQPDHGGATPMWKLDNTLADTSPKS
jgi:hypothetical protein